MATNDYIAKYNQYSFEQLWSMLFTDADPTSVAMAALPWKSVRETLEDANNRVASSVSRLMQGWQGEAADEFADRMDKLSEFSSRLAGYIEETEAKSIPLLSAALKEAREKAESYPFNASRMSYEEWKASRPPWEMDDRAHYENEQRKERLLMASYVGKLAETYDEVSDRFDTEPPPKPAPGTPGENAPSPGGPLFGNDGLNGRSDGSPAVIASNSGSTGSMGSTGSSSGPVLPAGSGAIGATDGVDWQLSGEGDADESGAGLYAGTAGPAAGPAGGGVGSIAGASSGSIATGAGAAAIGVAGSGSAASTASTRGGSTGSRVGPGGTTASSTAAGKGTAAVMGRGGAGTGRPGAGMMGAAGGRPGESGEETEGGPENWLTEQDFDWTAFDPNSGPADDYDPKAIREWERMYDAWMARKAQATE
ncbi:WXG100 family type VII secretion target [Natronoglycomyces albus]|uniref:PPE domain-containing protein n=1 Tax=Natronoglycomyces albus TaxID=2811108 RepID=A0A895XPU3_9ACTN|nr:hypothetical protein [Natronoglycomyces albus]QSB05125.1 hypothetical protein JQS30_15410 [Natronoglycomyces albus]